ncbi:transposase [Acidocella sp.]|uniref:transposase n=1 Tax=Acidocella sp. TaxID=50710 RepID=UPI00261CD586|nr:transposase [Acidocella sp.]
MPVLKANIAPKASLMTDQAGQHRYVHKHFASYGTTNHSARYIPTLSRACSQSSSAMRGIYQHCGEQHLHRYLTEFDTRTKLGFTDADRAALVLRGVEGKRLTYQQAAEQHGPKVVF